MWRVYRKHPAGSPDHQTESAFTGDGPENLPRLTQETYPAPPFCPACPAALVLHSSSTEVNLRGQLTPLWPASCQHQNLSDMYMQLLTQDKTLDKHLTEDFFCLGENKFYLLCFLQFLPVNDGFLTSSFEWQPCYRGFTFAAENISADIRLFLGLPCSSEIAVQYIYQIIKMV